MAGPNSPGTLANDASVGSVAWSNPSNAATQDDAFATSAMGFFQTSQRLKATNFGFSGLTGNLAGVKVEIDRHASGSSVFDLEVKLIDGAGAIVGDNKSAGPAYATSDSDTYQVYGGETDLWGTALTLSDVMDSDFGLALRSQNGAFGSRTSRVDHVRVTVYTNAGGEIGIAAEAEIALAVTPSQIAAEDAPVHVSVAFDPASTSLFTDVSDRHRRFTIRRGRPFNLDRVQAGICDAEFADGDGALDPANAESPYAPILPLRNMRIFRAEDGVTYHRFRGPIERFLPDWKPPSWQFMRVGASDMFEALANIQLISDQATLETTLAGSNNDLVFTAVEPGGQGDDITIEYLVAGTDTELAGERNEPVEGTAYIRGELRAGQLGNLFGSLFGGQRGRSAVIPVDVSIQGRNIVFQIATNSGGSPTSTANDIIATVEGSAELSALVSVELAPGNNGTGVVEAMPATNLSGGKFGQELTGDRINRVLDRIGLAASQRSIDPGAYEVVAKGFGPNENVSVLSHLQDVADAELGYLFVSGAGRLVYHDGAHRVTDERSTSVQAIYSDDDTGYRYAVDRGIEISFDKDRIVNEVTVTAAGDGAVPQTVSDSESQALYGVRSLSRQTQLADDEAALTQAESILAAYADPLTRFERVMLIDPEDEPSVGYGYGEGPYGGGGSSSSAWASGVLGREIGDRVKVRMSPPAHSTTIEYDCFIEEIEDVVSYDFPWRTAFRLTPISQSVGVPPGGGGGPGGPSGVMLNKFGNPLILDDPVEGVMAA